MKKLLALLSTVVLLCTSVMLPVIADGTAWTCPVCGEERTTAFCSTDGTACILWTCPSCGKTDLSGNFCTNCGTAKVQPEAIVEEPEIEEPEIDEEPEVEETVEEPTATEKPAAKTGVTVKSIGAKVTKLKSGKETGSAATSLKFSKKGAFKVKANKKGVKYWLINGVRYDFGSVQEITVKDLTWDMTIEAVYEGKDTKTANTAASIQEARTGDKLVVKSINAYMNHLQGKKAGGDNFTSFNFTNDYTNKATNGEEKGGQVSVKVTAKIPTKDKEVKAWKFNDAKLSFGKVMTSFNASLLDANMEYEPIFSKKVEMVTLYADNYCNVGGKQKVTVPKGTSVTVSNEYTSLGRWQVNGVTGSERQCYSITIKVMTDTHVNWLPTIN